MRRLVLGTTLLAVVAVAPGAAGHRGQARRGVEYFYAHLSRYAVPAGTRVRAGQPVAANGQSGNARYSAPHVHFEVHPGGPGSAPVNPYPYVRRACP
jgi:murein DD-endopeptidase MepM/ murein hydrolase activator NlpD